uniref:SH3 domain-binding protein 5 n=1 Tax=Nothoprocta perdicaria TaxID=30464 RepID=A0A8C7EE17_NOTPE
MRPEPPAAARSPRPPREATKAPRRRRTRRRRRRRSWIRASRWVPPPPRRGGGRIPVGIPAGKRSLPRGRRWQEELERLNEAGEEINRVELELDEARATYRRVLSDSARQLDAQASLLGNSVEKSRPYYEARRLAKEAQQEAQRAALRYERAVGLHGAARHMVAVAEQGVRAPRNRLDPAWQELLNHATGKVGAGGIGGEIGGEIWGNFGKIWGNFGKIWGIWGKFGGILGKIWGIWGKFWGILGKFWGILGKRLLQSLLRMSLRLLLQLSLRLFPTLRVSFPGERRGAAALPGGRGRSDGRGCRSTIASDLQKFDSVEHLRSVADAASLHGPEEPEPLRSRGRPRRSRSL